MAGGLRKFAFRMLVVGIALIAGALTTAWWDASHSPPVVPVKAWVPPQSAGEPPTTVYWGPSTHVLGG